MWHVRTISEPLPLTGGRRYPAFVRPSFSVLNQVIGGLLPIQNPLLDKIARHRHI
jgi:hypothetical protein